MTSTGSIHRIRRIDLRGADGAVDHRRPCPGPGSTSRPRRTRCSRSWRPSAPAGSRRSWSSPARFDGAERDDIRVPVESLGRALDELDPDVRAGLEESIRRLRATCEAELEHDVRTEMAPGAVVTHRKVPVDRVGLYVPGGLAPLVSSVVMNVVPAQVAGVGSDRAGQPAAEERRRPARSRRSSPRARCSASTRCTPSAAPRRSRCSPTEPVRARGSTWSPAPATSTSPRPSGCCVASSASTPRRAPRRSRSSPTTPPIRRTSRRT